MASYTSNFGSGWATLILNVSESNVSVANNTSTISWSLQVKKIKSCSSSNSGGATIRVTIGGTVRGSTSTFTIASLAVGSTKTILSGSYTATHNSNGALSLSCQGYFASGVGLGTATASGTFTCTTIPRVSDISVTPTSIVANGTATAKATATKKSSSFTDTITVKLGTHSMTVTSGTAFTIPESWCDQITTGESKTATVTVTTKNGSTTIGTKSVSLTVTVPDTVVPNVTATVDDCEEMNITDNPSYYSKFGYFIVGYSRYRVSTSTTLLYGATLKSVVVQGNGSTKTVTNPATSEIIEATSVLQDTTYNSITVTVTDSRNRTGTYTISNLPTRGYTSPSIDIDDVVLPVRCNQDGTGNEKGDYIKSTLVFTHDDIDGLNTATAKLSYIERGGSTTHQEDIYNNTQKIIFASHSYTWFLTYTVIDLFGNSVSLAVQVNTYDAVFSAKKGFQVAIGKSAESGTSSVPVFESAWYTLVPEIEATGNMYIDLDDTATSGTDYELITTITSLGWDGDCLG